MHLQADLCDAVATGAGQHAAAPDVVKDGKKSNVSRQLDVGGPACQQPLPLYNEVVKLADDEGSNRFSAPANLLATWMQGVSNSMSAASSPTVPSYLHAPPAQSAASAKDLKRYGACRNTHAAPASPLHSFAATHVVLRLVHSAEDCPSIWCNQCMV